jgi:WD40 repeat protein
MHRMSLHKVKVQSLDFSFDEQFLVSLGGQDDNSMVIWDVLTAKAICGSQAHNQPAFSIKFFNNTNTKLVSAGNYNLRVWEYDMGINKLVAKDAVLGQFKREFRTITIDLADQYAYCGTTTGDVLQVSLDTALFKNLGPSKENLHTGATASFEAPTGDIIVGAGDGSLVVMSSISEPLPGHTKGMKKLARKAAIKVEGAVTSIVYSEAHHLAEARQGVMVFYVGTSACNVYKVTYEPRTNRFVEELFMTAHSDKVNGLAFPQGYGEVFATCGLGFIRVWHLSTCRELLRIAVPNLEAHCVIFSSVSASSCRLHFFLSRI